MSGERAQTSDNSPENESTRRRKQKQAEHRYRTFTGSTEDDNESAEARSPTHQHQQQVTFHTNPSSSSAKKSKPSKLFKKPSFTKPKGMRRDKAVVGMTTTDGAGGSGDTSSTRDQQDQQAAASGGKGGKSGKKKSSSLPRDLKVSFKDKKEKKDKKKRTNSIETNEDENEELAWKPVFGRPLAEVVERTCYHDDVMLPAVVRDCMEEMEKRGVDCEGIYRVSGVKSTVEHLVALYNCEENPDLSEFDPHTVASVLKTYLRALPQHILTSQLHAEFEQVCAKPGKVDKIQGCRELLKRLPVCNRTLITWLIVHLSRIIDNEERSKMNVQNISIVMSPTLHVSHRLLNLLFTHNKEIFAGVEMKRLDRPMRWQDWATTPQFPSNYEAITSEIFKQEFLLNRLHKQVQEGCDNKLKDERLWEVQRIVTQLKRSKRNMDKTRSHSKLNNLTLERRKQTSAAAKNDSAKADSTKTDLDSSNRDAKKEVVDGQPITQVDDVVSSDVTSSPHVTTDHVHDSDAEEEEEDKEEEVEDDKVGDEVMGMLLDEECEALVEQEELIKMQQELMTQINEERNELQSLEKKLDQLKRENEKEKGNEKENENQKENEDFTLPDEEEDENSLEELLALRDELLKFNREMELKNEALSLSIHDEREAVVESRSRLRCLHYRHRIPPTSSPSIM